MTPSADALVSDVAPHLRPVRSSPRGTTRATATSSAAQVLAGTVRQGDVLARLGGDEFGIVAVGAGPEQADEMVQRADRAMRLSGVAGSFGFAPYSVVTGFPGAWEAADRAMYEQKRCRRGWVGA